MRPVQREANKCVEGEVSTMQQQSQQPQQQLQQQSQQQPQQPQQQSQQQPQQPQQPPSAGGGAAFSPTRRVGARGGPQLFAQKLFTLVEEENPEIVEWLPDGLAFRVKDIQRFTCEVLDKYFNRE